MFSNKDVTDLFKCIAVIDQTKYTISTLGNNTCIGLEYFHPMKLFFWSSSWSIIESYSENICQRSSIILILFTSACVKNVLT